MHSFSEDDLKYIKASYKTHVPSQIAQHLGRNISTVKNWITKFKMADGDYKPRKKITNISPLYQSVIRDLNRTKSIQDIANEFNKSLAGVKYYVTVAKQKGIQIPSRWDFNKSLLQSKNKQSEDISLQDIRLEPFIKDGSSRTVKLESEENHGLDYSRIGKIVVDEMLDFFLALVKKEKEDLKLIQNEPVAVQEIRLNPQPMLMHKPIKIKSQTAINRGKSRWKNVSKKKRSEMMRKISLMRYKNKS